MTSRNLNRTWRDVLFKQYAADLEADVPFPVRYLISIPMVYGSPRRDTWINIPAKIDLKTFKVALLAFTLATRDSGDPTYQSDHITVHPRRPAKEAHPGTTQDDISDVDAAGAGADADGDTVGQ